MYMKGLKFLLISLAVLAVYVIDVSFKAPQSAKVNVAGRDPNGLTATTISS